MKKNKNKKLKKIIKKFKKYNYKWIISATYAVITLCFALSNQSSIMDIFGSVKIDFSKIIPYEWAGFCTNHKEVFIESQDMIDDIEDTYNKACTIRTYFKNSMSSVYRISDMFINIKEISPIIESRIDISATVIDNCIHVYAINQGLDDAKNVQITLKLEYLLKDNRSNIDINTYFNIDNYMPSIMIENINGGEIIELFSIDIEQEFIDFVLQNYNWIDFYANISVENNSKKILLGALYYSEFDQEILITKSEGEDYIATTYFYFLNVDNKKGIYPIQMTINPNIKNDFNVGIDTIIIPNQSCDIVFSLSYKIGNKTIETEDFSAKIIVPLYNDDLGFYDSLLEYCVENQIKCYKYGTLYPVENALKYDIYTILDSFDIIQ